MLLAKKIILQHNAIISTAISFLMIKLYYIICSVITYTLSVCHLFQNPNEALRYNLSGWYTKFLIITLLCSLRCYAHVAMQPTYAFYKVLQRAMVVYRYLYGSVHIHRYQTGPLKADLRVRWLTPTYILFF